MTEQEIYGNRLDKPIVAIDFDGTLVTNAWPEIGEWMPGATDALRRISEYSQPVIYTARVSPLDLLGRPRPVSAIDRDYSEIRAKLAEGGFDPDTFPIYPKLSAVAYIDDRAIRYAGRPASWRVVAEKVEVMVKLEAGLMPELIKQMEERNGRN